MACFQTFERAGSFVSTAAGQSDCDMSDVCSTASFDIDHDSLQHVLRGMRSVRFGRSEVIEYILEAADVETETLDGMDMSEAEQAEGVVDMERWNKAAEVRRLKKSATACISASAPPPLAICTSRLWQRRASCCRAPISPTDHMVAQTCN